MDLADLPLHAAARHRRCCCFSPQRETRREARLAHTGEADRCRAGRLGGATGSGEQARDDAGSGDGRGGACAEQGEEGVPMLGSLASGEREREEEEAAESENGRRRRRARGMRCELGFRPGWG